MPQPCPVLACKRLRVLGSVAVAVAELPSMVQISGVPSTFWNTLSDWPLRFAVAGADCANKLARIAGVVLHKGRKRQDKCDVTPTSLSPAPCSSPSRRGRQIAALADDAFGAEPNGLLPRKLVPGWLLVSCAGYYWSSRLRQYCCLNLQRFKHSNLLARSIP